MSGPNVWSRTREKIRHFPELFAQCAGEMFYYRVYEPMGKPDIHPRIVLLMDGIIAKAAGYGKCVAATTTGRQELRKDLCAKEFEALKTCFTNAAKKRAK